MDAEQPGPMTDQWLTAIIRRGLYESVLRDGIFELRLLTELDAHTEQAGLQLMLCDGSIFRIYVTQTQDAAPYVKGRVY